MAEIDNYEILRATNFVPCYLLMYRFRLIDISSVKNKKWTVETWSLTTRNQIIITMDCDKTLS